MVDDTYLFSAVRDMTDCYGGQPYTEEVSLANWTSSDTAIASVANTGLVTGNSVGTVTITARWTDTRYISHYYEDFAIWECVGSQQNFSASTTYKVDTLRVRVPNAPVPDDTQESVSAGIIAGQAFQIQIDAVDANGNVSISNNQSITVVTSRTLDASESGLPSTITLSNGSYVSTITLNRVNNTERGTTFRFAPASGGHLDFALYTYFSIIATREGLVGNTTACGHVITSNDNFVALPSTGLCNTSMILRNSGAGVAISSTVRDVGPWFPHATATTGNPCQGGDAPYWNTGGVPRTETVTCDTNNAGIDLGDGTFSSLGLTNPTRILWRFN